MNQSLNLFQIAYNQATWYLVERGGFRVLDNRDNERPDWFEYWPIRKFLLSHTIKPDEWYGFFSPKLTGKTGMDYSRLSNLIASFGVQTNRDVVLFSPQPDMGAFFLNVFEQGEFFDSGFLDTAARVLSEAGVNLPLKQLVMDSRQIVFSNFFAARGSFWRRWFELAEVVFSIAEDSSHALNAAVCQSTSYGNGVNRKVFLIERLASALIVAEPSWKVYSANCFEFAWSASRLRQFPSEAYMSDALKIAFRETGFPQYMEAFNQIRERL